MYSVITFADVQCLVTMKLLPLFFFFLLTWSSNTELKTSAVNWNNLSLCQDTLSEISEQVNLSTVFCTPSCLSTLLISSLLTTILDCFPLIIFSYIERIRQHHAILSVSQFMSHTILSPSQHPPQQNSSVANNARPLSDNVMHR